MARHSRGASGRAALGAFLLFVVDWRIRPSRTVFCMPPRAHQSFVRPLPSETAVPPPPVQRAVRVLCEGPAIIRPGSTSQHSLITRRPMVNVSQHTPEVPASGALQPLRADGLVVDAYARGSKKRALEIAADPALRMAAASALKMKVFASTNIGPTIRKLETWRDVAHAAGHRDAFLPSGGLIFDVMGSLRAAEYRSLSAYASLAKQ